MKKMQKTGILDSIKNTPAFLASVWRAKKGLIKKPEQVAGEYQNEKGQLVVSEKDWKKHNSELADERAREKYGDDENARLDDGMFPRSIRDRRFILSEECYGNGKFIKLIQRHLKSGNWVFLWGSVGRGKTATATRAAMELMKRAPRLKASFISMNQWIKDKHDRKEDRQVHRIVVLDDVDKFDITKEFQAREFLRLINLLEERDAFVILTSQISIDAIKNRGHMHMDALAAIDRIRGRCELLEKYEGQSMRGNKILTED